MLSYHFCGPTPACSSERYPISVLTAVEETLYGQAGTGALIERIERIEHDVFGGVQPRTTMIRIDRVNTFCRAQKRKGSVKLHLNWLMGVPGVLTDGKPLIERSRSSSRSGMASLKLAPSPIDSRHDAEHLRHHRAGP